ncbi:MAG: branched-chain amino acid ABC transporter permease [Gaiellales bacterium]
MSTGIQYVIDGIAFGSLFALMALGLALLFSVMGLMNFAYGELIMAGGFTMYYTRGYGWVAMVVITVAVVVVLSVLMELIAFRPLRNASPITLLISSFAVSYGLQQLGWMTVGKGPQKGVEPYPWLTVQMDIGGVLVSRLAILTICVTVLLLIGMTMLLKRTTLGMQLRASTEDFHMAQLVGVRANYVISAAFAITGFLAAAVALLYLLRTGSIDPELGRGPLLIAFVGAVIGGLGSLPGAALGGFVLGVVINVLQAALPTKLASHTTMFAFLLVIAILVLRPDGLITVRLGFVSAAWKRLRGPSQATEGAGS